MATEKVLLVWFSRTGATRAVGEAIARALGADAEALVDTTRRTGVLGIVRASFDAVFGRLTTLAPVRHDPETYDLVIVGTPVWVGSVTPAVRTYLRTHRGRLNRVAFFCTSHSGATQRAFEQMAAVSGRAPIDILSIREDEVGGRDLLRRVGEFVTALTRTRVAA